MRPRWVQEADFDGSFMYCRAHYTSVRNTGSGSGWNTDYPAADNNFSVRLAELTRVPVKFRPDRQPHHVVVSLADPLLFRCPVVFIEDTGTPTFPDYTVLGPSLLRRTHYLRTPATAAELRGPFLTRDRGVAERLTAGGQAVSDQLAADVWLVFPNDRPRVMFWSSRAADGAMTLRLQVARRGMGWTRRQTRSSESGNHGLWLCLIPLLSVPPTRKQSAEV